jgi:CheY-like chemotaxis protein
MIRVLVVEDNEVIRDLLREILEESGCAVSVAKTLRQALALAETTEAPAVLVSDIHLGPGETGLVLAETVRQRWPQTRIVLMSGDHSFQGDCTTRGCTFLSKPFRTTDLLEAVLRH